MESSGSSDDAKATPDAKVIMEKLKEKAIWRAFSILPILDLIVNFGGPLSERPLHHAIPLYRIRIWSYAWLYPKGERWMIPPLRISSSSSGKARDTPLFSMTISLKIFYSSLYKSLKVNEWNLYTPEGKRPIVQYGDDTIRRYPIESPPVIVDTNEKQGTVAITWDSLSIPNIVDSMLTPQISSLLEPCSNTACSRGGINRTGSVRECAFREMFEGLGTSAAMSMAYWHWIEAVDRGKIAISESASSLIACPSCAYLSEAIPDLEEDLGRWLKIEPSLHSPHVALWMRGEYGLSYDLYKGKIKASDYDTWKERMRIPFSPYYLLESGLKPLEDIKMNTKDLIRDICDEYLWHRTPPFIRRGDLKEVFEKGDLIHEFSVGGLSFVDQIIGIDVKNLEEKVGFDWESNAVAEWLVMKGCDPLRLLSGAAETITVMDLVPIYENIYEYVDEKWRASFSNFFLDKIVDHYREMGRGRWIDKVVKALMDVRRLDITIADGSSSAEKTLVAAIKSSEPSSLLVKNALIEICEDNLVKDVRV